MAAFMIYAIRWAVSLTLLYSFYGLLLRNETFHRLNRAVLTGIIVLAMALPLCEFKTSRPTTISVQMERIENTVRPVCLGMDSGTAGEDSTADAAVTAPAPQRASGRAGLVRVLIMAYLVGMLCFVAHYLLSLASLVRIICTSRHIGDRDGKRILFNSSLPTSCSWMHWIMLRDSPDTPDGRMICEHEMAHACLRHSWDMLLAELTARLLWPLPQAWMLRADLRNVHEYEADRYVVSHGAGLDEYGRMLIHNAARPSAIPLANAFVKHSIKNRLKMMYTKKSKSRAALKAAYLLPLALVAVAAFARPTVMDEIVQMVETEAQEIKLPALPPMAGTAQEQKAVPDVAESATLPADTVKAVPLTVNEDMEPGFRQAQYPGGEKALMELLTRNLQYKGKDGHVIVQFTITKEGKTKDFNVLRSLDPASDAEVIRVLLMMEKWTPASRNGEACETTFSVPVRMNNGKSKRPRYYEPGNNSKNPRGVYKLACTITPDGKEIRDVFDQYKICLDYMTLTLSVSGNGFNLLDNDHMAFDYTGEEPDPDAKHRSRIYDSDETAFTLKWWSTFKNHLYFPDNDWCTERYESGYHTEDGLKIVQALTQPVADATPRTAGAWQMLGSVKDIKSPKKAVKQALKKHGNGQPGMYVVWNNGTEVDFCNSTFQGVTLGDDAVSYAAIGKKIPLIWLDDNHFAIKQNNPSLSEPYTIWQRLPKDKSVLDAMLGQ